MEIIVSMETLSRAYTAASRLLPIEIFDFSALPGK